MSVKFISKIAVALLFASLGALGCGSANILVDFGSETDQSLLFDAKQKMNKGNWSGAIENFNKMSTEYLDRRDVKFFQANAYAGRCGLDFLSFIENLTNIGATRLLLFLMQSHTGSTLGNGDDCVTAEALVKSISGNVAERTTDENTFMAFMSFTKMGVFLSALADTNGDNSPDGGFDACSVGSMTDDQVKDIGTGLANALTSLSGPGVSLGGDQVTDLTSICADIVANLGPSFDFCGSTNKADITPDMVRGIRTLVGEGQALGIGSCTAGPPNDLANCACP